MKTSEEELIGFGGEPDEVFFERSIHAGPEGDPENKQEEE